MSDDWSVQVSIPLPFTAVPLTLQPTIVLLGGLALGSRLGSASQILYLAAGIAGLPVFAASVALPPGPLRLLGPTGGYLMAYPLAAFVAGYLAERGFDRKYVTSVVAMLPGLLVIYATGVTWLGLFARTGEASAPGMSAAFFAGAAFAAGVEALFALPVLMPTEAAKSSIRPSRPSSWSASRPSCFASSLCADDIACSLD